MGESLQHTSWFLDTGKRLKTIDDKEIQLWEFSHQRDDLVLSAWAKHFREHYCGDDEIDFCRKGTDYSRAEYLTNMIFPDAKKGFGPGIRAGDFSEILISDYLEYVLNFWVPRTRYQDKDIRNESTKGCDIIGFMFNHLEKEDTLAIFEVKAQFSLPKKDSDEVVKPRLLDAVDGSSKDSTRKGESLNAIKRRLYKQQKFDDASKVERFQNITDHPYKEIYGAVAFYCRQYLNKLEVANFNANHHAQFNNLMLLIIYGNEMMDLVHELYKRSADEA